MYRDDDTARASRANALIDEIAALERQKVEHAATERRLEAARLELRGLQAQPDTPQNPPGAFAHVLVFGAAACTAFAGYTLLF